MRLSLTTTGKKNRVYPELDVGDDVKIFRKRKPNEQERLSSWFQQSILYTVDSI